MSRTYRKAPLSTSTRRTRKGRALRDGAVIRERSEWAPTLRHRRREAAADPAGRAAISPGWWAERARPHVSARESHFWEEVRRDGAQEALCSCGQRHCDYDLTAERERRGIAG